MGVTARRSNYTGRATPITDVAIVNGNIEEFRAKYGIAGGGKVLLNDEMSPWRCLPSEPGSPLLDDTIVGH
jgi:hypothetical protein